MHSPKVDIMSLCAYLSIFTLKSGEASFNSSPKSHLAYSQHSWESEVIQKKALYKLFFSETCWLFYRLFGLLAHVFSVIYTWSYLLELWISTIRFDLPFRKLPHLTLISQQSGFSDISKTARPLGNKPETLFDLGFKCSKTWGCQPPL